MQAQFSGPVYVVRDNIDTDQIIPAQFLNLVPTIPEEYEKLGSYAAKTRYRQSDAACTLSPAERGFRLAFDEPQWAVTPGQSVVLYESRVCLGGGIIEEAVREPAGAPPECPGGTTAPPA